MVEVRELALAGIFEIIPQKFGDQRGFFSETWNEAALAEAGIRAAFVQDNHSFSAARGVLRGLHFQMPPLAQDKLVRVAKGAIYDVAVDIRRDSHTYGRWVSLVISADRWNQIFVPKGFAHGFVTLEPNTEVLYKVTAPYSPKQERAIRFDDPALSIDWPVQVGDVQLSEKDRVAGRMAQVLAEIGYNV